VGIGMSDPDTYDSRLAKIINYQNTFLHKEPKLDITERRSDQKKYDFVISSEVFEHIEPPIRVAFENLHRLLNRGGFCVFTVPYSLNGGMREHFADLFDYKIVKEKDQRVLINRTREGHEYRHSNLTFHGGHGQTLEMRIFNREGLFEILKMASFANIHFHKIEKPEYGIVWNDTQPLPITMTRA
jgi:SAM-dependent methyltransferase